MSSNDSKPPDSSAVANAVSPVSPTAQMTAALLTLNLNMSNPGAREAVEAGLRAWNSIPNVCQPMVNAITAAIDAINAHAESVKLHFNPEIGLLSDFVQHCKLIISVNRLQPDAILDGVEKTFEDFKREQNDKAFRLTVDKAAFIKNLGTQISLVLRIGEVFNVPVFTAYVVRDVFNNEALDSDETVGGAFMYNAKQITNYSRLDVLLELLLHAASPDPYDTVNVLIAHGINALIVSQFKEAAAAQPNAVIQTECNKFIALTTTTAATETVTPMIVKSVLIAIIQNPNVKTVDGKQFSDMFPSGQYVKYLGEVAYRASFNHQGPIMLQAAAPKAVAPEASAAQGKAGEAGDEGEAPEGEAGEAPGSDVNARPILARDVTEHPLTRTDIIVAAFTAINAAMGSNANIVAAGGAAVSYYIYDFVRDLNAGAFASFIPVSGLDVEALKQGCASIPMNDIDCFVFGEVEVSRQFLLMFSLYMMILYANFYERPKRYGVIHDQEVTSIQFNLSTTSSDNINLFMYGNKNEDANTRLISKRLKKNPKVQLVTQETKCFSQLVNPLCGSSSCVVDGYYMQPIDLVKKETEDFVILYESLYTTDPEEKPDLKALLESQYSKGADNMVSIKTTMLDLVCIFCNEDKALFIRIFMARKNPKDFARLRAFIEIYLLQLLRFKLTDATFLKYKDGLIGEITQLRIMMSELNKKYYLEQGNLAAVHADTADQLNADRANFLKLLRSIGRKIVLIPDPLDNAIPPTFRKETGMNTIRFFRSMPNPQIKHGFDMSEHMKTLYETYSQFPVDSDPETAMPNAAARTAYDGWLNDVFAQILFPPESEGFFREILGKILDKTQGIDFKDMPVMQSTMLELLDRLQKINAKGKDMESLKGPLVNNLLTAIRNDSNARHGSADYIGNRFVFKTIYKPVVFKTLVEQLLKLQGNPHLDLPEGDAFSDQVNTQIGRILLELNSNPIFKSGKTGWGGSTRKRKRVHKLNARTRSNRGLGARKKSRRKKRDAMNVKCKRTRRAAMNA